MPLNRRVPWLLCYDIANPGRLRKIHKLAVRFAIPLQYSVFLTCTTRSEMLNFVGQLESIIDPRYDDVRGYPLSTRIQPLVYGKPIFQEGILLLHSSHSSVNQLLEGEYSI